MDKDVTVKTKAADKLTDLRQAHNELAVAIMRYDKSHSREDKASMDQARTKIARLEAGYSKGRKLRREFVCAHPRRSWPWSQ